MITSGQAEAGTVSGLLCRVPAGPCTVLIANSGTASLVYVGAGTGVTVTTAGTAGMLGNRFRVPSGAVSPLMLTGYPGSGPTQLSVICASGSASVSWIISAAAGGTGP